MVLLTAIAASGLAGLIGGWWLLSPKNGENKPVRPPDPSEQGSNIYMLLIIPLVAVIAIVGIYLMRKR